jgi:hypothetical protein
MDEPSDIEDNLNGSGDDGSPIAKVEDAREAIAVGSSNVNRFPSKRIFGRHGAYPCAVCKVNPSKYKFKCCRFGYCSTACFKDHSQPGVCTAPSFYNPADRPVFKRRPTNPLADLDIPEADLLSKVTLSSLKDNKLIRDYLANPKLRRLLTKIDNSRDRHAALEKQMLIDPEFSKVVDVFASAIEYQQFQ